MTRSESAANVVLVRVSSDAFVTDRVCNTPKFVRVVAATADDENCKPPVNVGAFENTSEPVPVSSVSADARFALVGNSRKFATFAAGVVVASVVSPKAVRCAAAAPVP